MEWQQQLQEYLNAQSAKNRSPQTIKQYNYTLTQALKTINKPAEKIIIKDIHALLNKKDEQIQKEKKYTNPKKQLSSNSKKLILIILKNFLEFYKNYETAKEIKNQKIKNHHKEAIQITQKEAKTLTQQKISIKPQLNQRNSLIIELLFESGMRRSEITNLTRNIFKNFNPKEENQVVIIKGKGDKERKIIISTSWIKKYIEYANIYALNINDFSEPLFVSDKTGQALTPTSLTNLVKQISKEAKIIYNKEPISPHKLRSTYATNLNDAGENILKIQTLMGHDNLNTTKMYIKIKDEELKKTKITKL